MEDCVIVREELMLPFSSTVNDRNKANPKTGHFITPVVQGDHSQHPKHPSCYHSQLPLTFAPWKWPLKVSFMGWREPSREWTSWVHYMKSKHQTLWKKARVFDAIMSSTCYVNKDRNLVVGLVEKWCSNTNSFVFPWGEATVSLEDVVVLGGYSVLGHPVNALLGGEMEEAEIKLREAKAGMKLKSKGKGKENLWIKRFMYSGSEIEHEAFLSFWLGKFVFPDSVEVIRDHLFRIAVFIAKGECFALAPAVLASIYRDLSVLKAAVVVVNELISSDVNEGNDSIGDVIATNLWSPLCLVQLWAWERFPVFQPRGTSIKNGEGEPRSALWDKKRGVRVSNARLALNSEGTSFKWRPYVTGTNTFRFQEVYKEKGEWHDLESNEDILSFALCIRVSELVGLDCIEQYLPHRVAMQFGMDQDIPNDVPASNEIPEIVWHCVFRRPFSNAKIYIPSHNYDSGITVQYLDWWNQSVFDLQDVIKTMSNGVARRKRASTKRLKKHDQTWKKILEQNQADAPPGFHGKYIEVKVENDDQSVKLKPLSEILRACDDDCHVNNKKVLGETEPKESLDNVHGATVQLRDMIPSFNADDTADAPPGFHSKFIAVKVEEDLHIATNGNKEALQQMETIVHATASNEHADDATVPSIYGIPIGIAANYNMTDAANGDEDVKPMPIELLIACEKDQNPAKVGPLEEMDPVMQSTGLCNVTSNDKIDAETKSNNIQIPELDLESRVARLERIVAELKNRSG